MKQLQLHLRLDYGFDTELKHVAKRYLEWPLLFDAHYPDITRTHQAWTYSPFLQYNLNKELHYSIGIFRGSLGLICPRLHPWVTSQLPGLLHLPIKRRLSTSCTITNMILAVTGNDPLYRLAYREEVFCSKRCFSKQIKVISQIEQVISHFNWVIIQLILTYWYPYW